MPFQEIEQIEESWQTETKQLSTNMLRLEEDNRKMRGILLEQEGVNSREEGKPLHPAYA